MRYDTYKLEMFREYYNNYLTMKKFAEDYGMTEKEATRIVCEGRDIHDERVKLSKIRRAKIGQTTKHGV